MKVVSTGVLLSLLGGLVSTNACAGAIVEERVQESAGESAEKNE